MEKVVDSHCHVLDPRLKDKAGEIVACMEKDGLAYIVEISADPQEAVEALKFANQHKNVYCTCGVHPIFADQYSEDFEKWAEENCIKHSIKNNGKIVAIGECGFDFYHKDCPPDIQEKAFAAQIKLGHKFGLPLVVHTRDAFEDTFRVLLKYKGQIKNGLLIHCFSYGAAEADKLSKEFDAYFAFGGAVTYKNAAMAEEAIRAVRFDRLLLETDAPYLAPVPLRGSVNEPKNVRIVCEHVARVLNLTTDEVARKTRENTKRFYNIK